MRITRLSPYSGLEHSMEIDVTEEQLWNWSQGGQLIQDAMPNLTPHEREFIKTGLIPQEWDLIFGEE